MHFNEVYNRKKYVVSFGGLITTQYLNIFLRLFFIYQQKVNIINFVCITETFKCSSISTSQQESIFEKFYVLDAPCHSTQRDI